MGLFFSEQQQQPRRSKYYPTLREAPRVDGTILPMFPQASAIESVVYENMPRAVQVFCDDVINAAKERRNNISNPEESDVRQFSPTYGAALNVAGQAGGFIADAFGAGLKAVTPEPLRQSAEDFANLVLPGNPVYETAKDIWNALPRGTQNDIGNLANATLVIPAVGMVRGGANLSRDAIGTLKEVKKIPGDMIKAESEHIKPTLSKATPDAGVPYALTPEIAHPESVHPEYSRYRFIDDGSNANEISLRNPENNPEKIAAKAKGQVIYHETKVPVSDDVFEMVGVPQGNVFADYDKLQRKHPDHFPTTSNVKDHVEYVLGNPTGFLPATNEGYTLVYRQNGGDKAAVVEFVLRGGKYRVRSAFNMTKGQLQTKIERAQRGSSEPPSSARSPQGEISSESPLTPSDESHVEPFNK
jgi:hypothetical protein